MRCNASHVLMNPPCTYSHTGLKVDVVDRFGCSPLCYAALANRPLNAKVVH